MQLSILKIVLYILIPFAPLYARVVDLNGSLDHPWSMFPLFNILPFSIVPVLMMAFGIIKKGKGSKPYDNFMWIPIIFRFIASLLISMVIQNPAIKTLIILLISIITIMVPNLIRRKKNCENIIDKKNNTVYNVTNGKQIYRSFVDSLFELGFGEVFIVMMMFVPFIGIGFKLIGKIPIIGKFVNDIIWSFGFVCGYIIINMYNQDNMGGMCYPEKFNTGNEISRLVLGFVFLLIGGVASIIGKSNNIGNINKFKPFNKIIKSKNKIKID
jgi:hypothetical protein